MGDLVQPDFALVSKERESSRSAEKFERAVPNLVVEILSPATAKIDRSERKVLYERNGVDEHWIVDPQKRQIVAFRLTGDGHGDGTLHSSDQPIPSGVLRGFSCPVRDLIA